VSLGTYRLRFDGTITTRSRAEGQNLRAEIVTRRPGELAGHPSLLDWKYLQSDLTPGSTFTHQLARWLANDVFLKARVLWQFEIETAVGKLEKAIKCLYLVDYGVATAIDDFGQIVGYFRTYDYGTIVYAPTVGSVSSYERSFVQSNDPPTTGVGDATFRLIGTGLAVP
jgi:hypothetical protein